jgi:hypothetical protein
MQILPTHKKTVCVRENIIHLPGDHVSVHAPGPPQESLHDGTRTSRPAKPSPNSDNAGPIVRRLIGLPVVAGTCLEPASVATLFALQCSLLDRCATRDTPCTGDSMHGRLHARETPSF